MRMARSQRRIPSPPGSIILPLVRSTPGLPINIARNTPPFRIKQRSMLRNYCRAQKASSLRWNPRMPLPG